MTIGEALKEEQKSLGITATEMAGDIITKGTYSKVVNGKLNLSSDLLVRILLAHDIDIDEFFEMLKETYMSPKKLEEEKLRMKIKHALDNHKPEELKEALVKLEQISDNTYLKQQAEIALAFLENKVQDLSDQFKNEIIQEINDNDNWITNIDALRLFSNSMLVLPFDDIEAEMQLFFKKIARLPKLTEDMKERYAIVCDNYLACLVDRKIKNDLKNIKPEFDYNQNIRSAIKYLNDLESNAHFMIYRFSSRYYDYICEAKYDKAKKMRQQLLDMGCTAGVSNWSI